MECIFCKSDIKQFDEGISDHLVVTKASEHIHVHGDLNNKTVMKDMIDTAIEMTNLVEEYKVPTTAIASNVPKEVIFHNRQRIGDMLMFTCAVRDFKKAFPNTRVNIISTAMHIWDNNPHIDKTLKPFYKEGVTLENATVADFQAGKTNVIKIGPGKLTNMSNRTDLHFANAYRISIQDALKIQFEQGFIRGDIWLTKEEYDAPPLFDKPYWIIVIGGEKGWGCKMYPFERWQEFVNQNPDLTFVQIGASGDKHPRLQGANVIDHIGKTESRETGVRDLFKLFLNAEGSIGLVSFHMHLSGALEKPCIVVAGAREPVTFTRYVGHQYLATEACLPCALKACWHCNIDTCKALTGNKVPKCVDIITPDDLTRAINKYYLGGRLTKGIRSIKQKFTNIASASAVQIVQPDNVVVESPNIRKCEVTRVEPGEAAVTRIRPEPRATEYGLPFDGGSITPRDWDFIKETIIKNNFKTILEFGAGLSTLMLNDEKLGLKVVTYEDKPEWIEKIKNINPKCDVRLWDKKVIPDDIIVHDNGISKTAIPEFDLAFVDGPKGDGLGDGPNRREHSIRISSERARNVIVHDASRIGELKWQEKYLKEKFFGPGGGGQRCHLWSKDKDVNIAFRDGSPVLHKPDQADLPVQPIKECICGHNDITTISHLDFPGKKFIKLVSTARGWGGCARSITTIMKHLLQAGHVVEFIPFRNSVGSREFKEYIQKELIGKPGINDLKVTENYDTVSEQCDVFFMYADDYVWEFNKPEIANVFSNINTTKKIMMLNYRRGPVGQAEWTKGWDKYMFLNSSQEKELLSMLPGVKTKVLPPCTELDEFFKSIPSSESKIKLIRHSSQGDTKFAKDFEKELDAMLQISNVEVHMMPPPSFVKDREGVHKYPRNTPPIPKFLENGNVFWYSLPQGYMDQGPRVIVEALAAGLPVIADNWGGAIDRVTPECGWLCNTKAEMVEIVKNLTIDEIKKKGLAARERAKTFNPENWIKEIIE